MDKIKDTKAIKFVVRNKYRIAVVILLLIGCLVRLVNIENLPNGLNCDGKTMPVFLVSWGSGQNALYTYILIPFVKILGLNALSTRLPMALIGCISLFIFYKLLLLLKNKKVALIGLAFLAICPWHIMKSRWGLESNIFPDLVLLAVYLIAYGVKRKKNIFTYLGFGTLGLTSYAYGTAYFFLPFFVIPTLIYLVKKKEMKMKEAIISFLVMGIITIPIVLCVLINKFDLPEFQILCFTIPRMSSNRFEELSSVFSADFIKNSFMNFANSLKILITQSDGLGWNSIQSIGTTYIFSLPLTLIGIWKSFKRKIKNEEEETNRVLTNLFNIWFIVSIILLFICKPNINRINIIFIPIIYYTVVGLYEMTQLNNKRIKITVVSLLTTAYIFTFMAFGYLYINMDSDSFVVFEDDVKEVIEYVDSKEANKIYIDGTFKEPYIYMLFYTKEDPKVFHETIEFNRGDKINFGNVKSYKNIYFYLPETLEEGNIYVVDKRRDINIDETNIKVKEFEEFIVLEKEKIEE